jgi:hypothetical protein
MKNTILLFLLVCLSQEDTFSQKQDYIWPIGYMSNYNGSIATGETIDFNFIPPRIDSAVGKVQTFRVSAGICDSLGNLLFYTNGRNICNASGTLLSNSENMTDCSITSGCYFEQMAFVVPYPNHANQYVLFANNYDDNLARTSSKYAVVTLKYSIIDMSRPNGRGSVIEKNTPVLFDTLMLGGITGCRHANGRDWWVLVNKQYTTIWYRLLVSPTGVAVVGSQDIGFRSFERGSYAVFSQDGNWFATMQTFGTFNTRNDNFLELFRFDRCSGLLTRKEIINIPDSTLVSGVAISPNSRYLYTCTDESLHQFDLQVTNVAASKIKIAAYDGYTTIHGFWSHITIPKLAPNGKIYITSYPPTTVLHVIEAPDSAGLACNFRQHAIQLPTYNSAVPNYPNFRLGAFVGSGCDTIVANSELGGVKAKMRLFPNPVHDILNIDLTMNDYNHQGRVIVVLYDGFGRLVHRHQVSDYSSIVQVDVSGFGAGVYLVGLEAEGMVVASQKVVVSK